MKLGVTKAVATRLSQVQYEKLREVLNLAPILGQPSFFVELELKMGVEK
jgi:hypothetical protein